MAMTFDQKVADTPEGAKAAIRALQCWQILISRASSKSIITYGELANIIGFEGAGVFAYILGHILYYCQENGLPSLTSIVVKHDTGLPGEGFVVEKGMKLDKIPAKQMEVFEFNWFRIMPPTIEELKEACEKYS